MDDGQQQGADEQGSEQAMTKNRKYFFEFGGKAGWMERTMLHHGAISAWQIFAAGHGACLFEQRGGLRTLLEKSSCMSLWYYCRYR